MHLTKSLFLALTLGFSANSFGAEAIGDNPEKVIGAEVQKICANAENKELCIEQVKELMVTAFSVGTLDGKCELSEEDPYGVCSSSVVIRDHFENLFNEYLEDNIREDG